MIKYKPLILLTAIVVLGAASCKKGNQEEENPISSETLVELTNGERVFADHEFMYPQSLVMTADRLLVSEPREERGIYVGMPLTDTDSVVYLGSRGMGPCEFMSTRNAKYNFKDSTLYIYDPTLRKARVFRLGKEDEGLNEQNLLREIGIGNSVVHESQPCGDGMVSHWVSGNTMFALLDSTGARKKSFGVYPGDKAAIEDSTKFAMGHQVLLAIDDSEKHFVAAGRNSDWIAFYDLSGDQPELLKEYFTFESPVEVNEVRFGKAFTMSMKDLPETVTAYIDLIPTPGHVYAVYYGLSQQEMSEGKKAPVQIQKFSWTGEFQGGYKLTGGTGSISITPDERELYAISRGEGDNLVIKKHSLPRE